MKIKSKVAILIAAINEEKVLSETIRHLLLLVSSKDIYVVDDGSGDLTYQIARKFTKNVISLYPNQGKAKALSVGIERFKLTEHYRYIMPVDADSLVSPDFLKETLPLFEEDKDKKIACVIGKVMGRNHKWTTTYRLWEYEVSQTIHKAAQSIINAVIVCPGPSSIFRSEVFKKIKVPTGTLTEDMDLTFLIHRKKLGRIIYLPTATVSTQDPQNLFQLNLQLDRWYTGFWQCLIKHKIPWGGQALDFEVAMLATEGLFNGLLVLSLFVLIPLSLITKPEFFLIPLALDLICFQIPTLLLTAIRHKTYRIFFLIPQFYFLRALGSLIFLKSFIKIVLGIDLSMRTTWNMARYATRKEDLWPNPSPSLQ